MKGFIKIIVFVDDSLILRYKLHITDNKMTIQLDEDIANTYKTVQKRTVLKLEH